MKGQWIGQIGIENIAENVEGMIIANIDDLGNKYGGSAFVLPSNPALPSSAGFFTTTDKKTYALVRVYTSPINPNTGLITTWPEIKDLYPGIDHYSAEADVEIKFQKNALHLTSKTTQGVIVKGKLVRKPFTTTSDIKGDVKTWKKYKSFVSSLLGQKNLFRGQRKPWKLRTAFHRKGRYDLFRFLNDDVLRLYRHLSARTSHVFNLQIPDENGAFLNLVQHHGYPTPLLDWTYSPYVAAFFAFRGVPKKIKGKECVRVYIFNQEQWKNDWGQLVKLNVPGFHLSVMDFVAIENERLLPQQAATTLTNIDDIEAYVRSREAEKECSYLTAIDIPTSERNTAMQELSFMGITAGSMFPGLDGACEELREKMFAE